MSHKSPASKVFNQSSKSSPRKQIEKYMEASKRGWCDKVNDLVSNVSDFDLNHVGYDGKTALYHAIHAKHESIVQTLIQHGVDVNLKSFCTYHHGHAGAQLISCDEPPIVTATRLNNSYILKLLLCAGANPDIQTACHTHLSGLSVQDRTALHFACEETNVESVQLLLDHGADVNAEDRQGELPVHVAVRCRRCQPQSTILRLLCEHGTDVNLVNRITCTPLYLASFYGCVEKTEILLLYGADPNLLCTRNNSYGSPLHIAALKDRFALAQKLIAHGSQLNSCNVQQSTPLHLNICFNNSSKVASLLITHGANMNGRDRFNYTLMAVVIRDMRLDCETLARHMVYAGYDLRDDLWLQPPWYLSAEVTQNEHDQVIPPVPHVPIAPGRVEELCKWLQDMQQNPMRLQDLCRIATRKHLIERTMGKSILKNIYQLPLPVSLKDYIAFKEFD